MKAQAWGSLQSMGPWEATVEPALFLALLGAACMIALSLVRASSSSSGLFTFIPATPGSWAEYLGADLLLPPASARFCLRGR